MLVRLVIGGGLLAWGLASPAPAEAAQCGISDGHTLCVSVPGSPLSGQVPITVTNTPNDGTVNFTWVPSGRSKIYLMDRFMPSPETDDYSFVWPTQKYLDGSGVLRVQHGSTSAAAVDVSVSLSNGNTTDFQHSASDWANYLPQPWTGASDPVLAAVGDTHADEPVPDNLEASIADEDPAQLLFLGDMDDRGTFTENLNHYGVSALDSSSPTLWGALAKITQPTVGNHDARNLRDWRDYWHGRPDTTSFTFGGVLFLDLNSSESFAVGSPQYSFVQNALASAPPCVVALWHIPVLEGSTVTSKVLPMWSLLANSGGDLVLDGHTHKMTEYVPLDASLQPGGHMVELISGAGGHDLAAASSDPRVAWSRGKTAGVVYLTLNGAANGGTATSISWSFADVKHNVLHQSSVACGSSTPPPSISGFSPTSGPVGTSVTITGSDFTGATDVAFNGTAASFIVDSGTQITATVPSGATTGPISVTTPDGQATSSSSFTVTSSGPIQRVGRIGTVQNTSGTTQNSLSLAVEGTVAQGDTVVVGIGAPDKVTVSSVTDSRGNTYHVDRVQQYTSKPGAKSTTAIVTAPVTTALQSGDTITVTLDKGGAWGFVAEDWLGIAGLDQTGGADSHGSASSAVSVSTSGTTTSSPEAVFAVTTTSPWPGIAAGSGYIQTADLKLAMGTAKREFGLEYAIVSSTGAQTATFALGSARYWVAAIGTYH